LIVLASIRSPWWTVRVLRMVFQPPGSDYGHDADTKGQEARKV
jgi:hypothetical protein